MITIQEMKDALTEVEPEGFDWTLWTQHEKVKYQAIAQAAYSVALRDAADALEYWRCDPDAHGKELVALIVAFRHGTTRS